MLILFLKSETHLVAVARFRAGRQARRRAEAGAAMLLRRRPRLLPSFRPFQAVEASLLAFAAAVVDALADDLIGSRILVGALAVAAVVAVAARDLGRRLASGRLPGWRTRTQRDQ